MKYFVPISFILLLIVSCSDEPKVRKKALLNGEYSIGYVTSDSLFNGIVKHYDKMDQNFGYTTYKNGLKDGVAVFYFPNGAFDSSFFTNGIRNGFAYKYNSLNKILYKTYYYNDINIGHNYEYDSTGRLTHYYFTDLEGNTIYESWLIDTIPFEKGDLIRAAVNTKLIGIEEKDVLFLYLIDPPYIKTHYEVAVLDSQRQIISSQKIESKNCFYEYVLSPDLPPGQSHAIVHHTFNAHKGRDDLKISVIK